MERVQSTKTLCGKGECSPEGCQAPGHTVCPVASSPMPVVVQTTYTQHACAHIHIHICTLMLHTFHHTQMHKHVYILTQYIHTHIHAHTSTFSFHMHIYILTAHTHTIHSHAYSQVHTCTCTRMDTHTPPHHQCRHVGLLLSGFPHPRKHIEAHVQLQGLVGGVRVPIGHRRPWSLQQGCGAPEGGKGLRGRSTQSCPSGMLALYPSHA